MTDHQKWIGFKTKTKFADQIYKNPTKCSNIEKSVDFLSAFENEHGKDAKKCSNVSQATTKSRRRRNRKRKNGVRLTTC